MWSKDRNGAFSKESDLRINIRGLDGIHPQVNLRNADEIPVERIKIGRNVR